MDPGRRHFVSYPPETKPADTSNLYWIIKDPQKKYHSVALGNTTTVSVATPTNGLYRVGVEHWVKKKKKLEKQLISNVIDIRISDISPPPTGAPPQGAPSSPPPAGAATEGGGPASF
jgi:hypothetical protein